MMLRRFCGGLRWLATTAPVTPCNNSAFRNSAQTTAVVCGGSCKSLKLLLRRFCGGCGVVPPIPL